ncbi:MAG: hypothetical protein DRJ62_06870 [Thermoprotei archaeon]|nr:MAG: hypothetical protein DRJ62_06870 [Thermoprotei archaeon]
MMHLRVLRQLTAIYAFASLLSFSWGLFIPLYPVMLRSLGATPFLVGAAFAIFNGVSASLRMPFGYIADRRGKEPLILLSGVATCIASLIALLHLTPLGLIAALSALGVATALYYQTTYSLVADLACGGLGRTYGVLNVLSQAGWLIAPLVAGLLLDVEALHAVFLLALTSALIGTCSLKLLYKPMPQGLSNTSADSEDTPSRMSDVVKEVFRVGSLLMVVEALSGLATGFFQPSASAFLNEVLMGAYEDVGVIFTAAGLAMLAAQYPGGVLVDKIGGHMVYALSALVAVPPLILFSQSSDLFPASAFMSLYYFTSGFRWIGGDSMMAQHFPWRLRTVSMGIAWAFWRTGFAIGALSCGFMWETLGIRYTFIASALLLLASSLTTFKVVTSRRAEQGCEARRTLSRQ